MIKPIVDKFQEEMKEEQEEYENKTKHGLRKEIQAEYTQNFNSVPRN